MKQRRFWCRLSLLGSLAFGIRLLNVWYVERALGAAQILDAAYYHDVALALLGRQPALEGEVAFANLGYPHALSWLYALHASPTFALTAQALLGGLTAMLTGVFARELFGKERVGLWAAGLVALYAPSIFYDGLLLIPSLSVFTVALLAWSLKRAIRRASWHFAVLSGLALSAAALLRSSQLLLLPCSLLVIARLSRAPVRWQLGSALLLSVLICVAPIIVRQRLESGGWVPLTANGGMNLWIGNHPGATGGYASAPFLGSSKGGDFRHALLIERDRFSAEAARRSRQASLSLVQADAFWWRETARFIASSPSEWLRILVLKCRSFVNDYELRTNASFEFLARISPLLRYDPLRFGLLVVLAAFGGLQLRSERERNAGWLLAALIAAPLLTCLGFFVSGEYRHAAAPALAALAAFGVCRLPIIVETWRTQGRSAWPRYLLLLVVVVLAFSPSARMGPARDRKAYAEALATPSESSGPPTLERYALARNLLSMHEDTLEDRLLSTEASLLVESNQAIQFHDRAAAERLARASRDLQSTELRPNAPFDVATIERIRRNSVRRVAQLCRQPFVRQWPSIERDLAPLGCRSGSELGSESVANRVRALLDGGQHEAALSLLQSAVRDGPYDETLHYALGKSMLAHASPQATLEFFSAEAERDQKPQTSHYFMALAFEKMGRDDDCLAELGRALELDPAHEMSQRKWGLVLERHAELQPALRHLVEATRIHPEYQAALEDAARVADLLGRHAEAHEWRARARAANPDTPRRFVYWARYLHEQGREPAALAEVARRLAEAPFDAEARELERVIRTSLTTPKLPGPPERHE